MASSSEHEVMANAPDEDDDLFGDEDDAPVEKTRELSDQELDSGDDEDRNDRTARNEPEAEVDTTSGREARIAEQTVFRHHIPRPADEEFSILRLPNFLGIQPLPYDPNTFVPPEADHHSDTKSASFSASAVAASTVRYRKNPSTGQLESNTVVYRWSDGSTTISIGDQHYELQTKPLAPPKDSKIYQEVQDSHQYLATPSLKAQLLLNIGHLTSQHTVRPNKDIEDDALEKLQRSLAAATRGTHKGDDKGGPELIMNTQDPELEKKRAEIAEKERNRAQRRRETAAERQTLPRGPGPRAGLGMDDLGHGRRRPAKPGRKSKSHRVDYSSDEDLPRGRNREDDYDKEDGFLVDDDEEELEEGEEEDEEDMIDDESDREQPRAKKQKISKPEETSDADADAEADLDDEDAPAIPIPTDRGRKRRVIEDDDDDE